MWAGLEDKIPKKARGHYKRVGMIMKMSQILIIFLVVSLCICSGCVTVKERSRNSHSTSYSIDIGYKVVNSWLGKTGEIFLLKAVLLDGLYKLDGEGGAFKKKQVSLKIARIDKSDIWHLKDFDALILIGEACNGRPIHEIVTISRNKVKKLVLPADTPMLYKETSDFEKLVLGKMADTYENSRFYVFHHWKYEGPLPSSFPKGNLLSFFQDFYVKKLMREESEPVQSVSSPVPVSAKSTPPAKKSEPEYEVFQPDVSPIVPTDKVNTPKVKKVRVKID